MANFQEHKNGAEPGQATPLLANAPQHADEGSAATGSFGVAGALAPPPSAAPPPPPQDAPNAGNEGNDDDYPSYQNADESPAPFSSGDGDDDASRDRTSSTRSDKSGRSGKSRRKGKKGNDASSSRSGKSGNARKRKKKERLHKSICHLSFDAVRYFAIVANSMMFAMQVLPLVVLADESTWLQIAVRSYLAAFCLSFALAESRVPLIGRIASPRNNWVLRGFLYSFVGLVGMEQDLAVKAEDLVARTYSVLGPDLGTLFASFFMTVTSWTMIGVGVLYTLLGLLCMQSWYERLEEGHQKNLEKLKREKKAKEDSRKQREDSRRDEKDEKDEQQARGQWYDAV